MSWLQFARIVKRALEYLRAFLSELQPIKKEEVRKSPQQTTKSGKKVKKPRVPNPHSKSPRSE